MYACPIASALGVTIYYACLAKNWYTTGTAYTGNCGQIGSRVVQSNNVQQLHEESIRRIAGLAYIHNTYVRMCVMHTKSSNVSHLSSKYPSHSQNGKYLQRQRVNRTHTSETPTSARSYSTHSSPLSLLHDTVLQFSATVAAE